MASFIIDIHQTLGLNDLVKIIHENLILELSQNSIQKVQKGREYLEKRITNGEEAIYGINTGFGSLWKESIEPSKLEDLQRNLVRSHACGTGERVSQEISRWVLLLKIISLSKGYSGVSLELVQKSIELYNQGIYPEIFEMGSLGASGDLAPLAHLGLVLMGEGKCWFNGSVSETQKVFSEKGINPHTFSAKEGLAVLNGTQFMQALMGFTLQKAQQQIEWSSLISALSIDAFLAQYGFLHPEIQRIRNQEGQIIIAEKIRKYLEGSPLEHEEKKQVQDPYSFRCIPQVLGASYDAINHAQTIFEREVNGVTDNPNVIPESDLIISGGNFHGQTLAISLDLLSISLSEIGNISERRIFRLLMGKNGLPEFLIQKPGLNSGLMIPQYTAASLVSMNKQLATPSSVDSISSSNGQEDHVSMGANAGLKTMKISENLDRILAIELMTASQALSFRSKPTSSRLQKVVDRFRERVSIIENDRILHEDIENSVLFIQNEKIEGI